MQKIDFGRIKGEKKGNPHIPSTIQADTLFTFTDCLEYILSPIREKKLFPRYCTEDISYLGIRNLKMIAFPMKCFCDINMHRLGVHLQWYGYYGLAFSKEWGMRNNIQPIQYINPQSALRKDFCKAFSEALQVDETMSSQTVRTMQNFLLHELMYYKPYSGKMKHPVSKKNVKKCFADECEWRYIADVTVAGYEQVFYDQQILNAGNLYKLSDSLQLVKSIALNFEYTDLKYIIVARTEDFEVLAKEIQGWRSISEEDKQLLLSKIIIWEVSKGDF